MFVHRKQVPQSAEEGFVEKVCSLTLYFFYTLQLCTFLARVPVLNALNKSEQLLCFNFICDYVEQFRIVVAPTLKNGDSKQKLCILIFVQILIYCCREVAATNFPQEVKNQANQWTWSNICFGREKALLGIATGNDDQITRIGITLQKRDEE